MQGIDASTSAANQPQHLPEPPTAGPSSAAPGQQGQSAAAHAAASGSAGAASATSLVSHNASTVSFVHQQVDMMLANIGQGAQDQQTLRLLIALLILQQLMDEPQGEKDGAAQLLGQIGAGSGSVGGSFAALSSQTTTMQVHQQQTFASSHQAVQGAAVSQYANGAAGEQDGQPKNDGVDVTA